VTAHSPMALWPKAGVACWSWSRTVVVGVSMRLAILQTQRTIAEHRDFRFSDPVTVSGTNSVDARRKRAKYQGTQQIGMGTWFFVGGLSQFGWPRSGMGTRQDEAGLDRRVCTLFEVYLPLDAILWLCILTNGPCLRDANQSFNPNHRGRSVS
jgi:hypothetical protein